MPRILRPLRWSLIFTCLFALTACGGGGDGDEPDGGGGTDAATRDAAVDGADASDTQDSGPTDDGGDSEDGGVTEDAAVDPCETNPCMNGATCAADPREPGAALCTCAAGWTGDTCEASIDDCLARPCENGGTCTDGHESFTCECADGFDGPTCATNVDDCPAVNPCLNGGTCVDRVNDYVCACTGAFGGPTCATACSGVTRTAKWGNHLWTSPDAWVGDTVPAITDSVVIPMGITVTVPEGVSVHMTNCASITVTGTLINQGDFTADDVVNVQGPNPAVAGLLQNEGTFTVNRTLTSSVAGNGRSELRNQAGATFRVRGPMTYNRFYNRGAFHVESGTTEATHPNIAVFSNEGTITVSEGASLFTTITNTDIAINHGTIVNRGAFESNHRFDNRGTFENEGQFKGVFDNMFQCGMENVAGATFTNFGHVQVSCPFTNAGSMTNMGTITVIESNLGRYSSPGTFTNERTGVFTNYGNTSSSGTWSNRGELRIEGSGQDGFRTSGMLTNEGTLRVVGRFFNEASGALVLESGSNVAVYGLFNTSGTVDLHGAFSIFPGGAPMNSGTFTVHCGGAITQGAGASGFTGNQPVTIACP